MRSKRWMVVAGVCLGLLVVLGFIKFMQIRAAIAFGDSFPEPSETVESQIVNFSEWQQGIVVIGEVRASRELELRTEVQGMISQVGFESGAKVKSGDLLLQLDIAKELATLESIKPQIKLAKQDVKRLSGLASRQAVSQQEADRASAQLAIAEAQAASARDTIADKSIIAPFDGITGLHDLEVGEFLPANTLVTRLVGSLETLWVDFAMPQRYASLPVGTDVSILATDIIDRNLSAKVTAVEPTISSQSRTLQVRATLTDPNQILKPGGIVRVSVPVDDQRFVVRLPSTAVRVDTLGAYVFVLSKDTDGQWRAARRPVSVIAKEGDDSIVEQGLEAGEVVATKGSFKLREGLLVYHSEKPAARSAPVSDEQIVESIGSSQEVIKPDGAELLLGSDLDATPPSKIDNSAEKLPPSLRSDQADQEPAAEVLDSGY